MDVDLDKVKRSWEAILYKGDKKISRQMEEHILQTIQLLQELKDLRVRIVVDITGEDLSMEMR